MRIVHLPRPGHRIGKPLHQEKRPPRLPNNLRSRNPRRPRPNNQITELHIPRIRRPLRHRPPTRLRNRPNHRRLHRSARLHTRSRITGFPRNRPLQRSLHRRPDERSPVPLPSRSVNTLKKIPISLQKVTRHLSGPSSIYPRPKITKKGIYPDARVYTGGKNENRGRGGRLPDSARPILPPPPVARPVQIARHTPPYTPSEGAGLGVALTTMSARKPNNH